VPGTAVPRDVRRCLNRRVLSFCSKVWSDWHWQTSGAPTCTAHADRQQAISPSLPSRPVPYTASHWLVITLHLCISFTRASVARGVHRSSFHLSLTNRYWVDSHLRRIMRFWRAGSQGLKPHWFISFGSSLQGWEQATALNETRSLRLGKSGENGISELVVAISQKRWQMRLRLKGHL